MYQEPKIDKVAKNLRAVLNGLSGTYLSYLRRPVGGPVPVLDDAQSLEELKLLSAVAQRSIVELQFEKPLNDDSSADDLKQSLGLLVKEIRDVTTGHGQLPGRQAHAAVLVWLDTVGTDVRDAYEDLRWRLAAQLVEVDAEIEATKPKPPAPKVPRTNQQVLTDQFRLVLGRAAPGGTLPTVRAYLVIGGVMYRGDNDGTTLAAPTLKLIKELVSRQEDWTITGCAEVHALDAYVRTRNFTTADQVRNAFTRPPGNITDAVIGAMDAVGRTGRYWVKRVPCDNCVQWLAQLRITADTAGAQH
ncbi:hypothetical protein OHV05_30770 [Kitasatospora sp. NBC_00070]|uniref:hypothetical protein n=1 Tax=Kitasatospora sp. NBC_00070 TaxID=2975962 RepID=UPI003253F0FC